MSKESDDGKIVAILLWIIWPVGLIWWLADEKMKKNTFVKHHIKQWLLLLIVSVAYTIISMILTMITLGLFALISWIGYILILVWWVQMLIYAIQGSTKKMFWIGEWDKIFKF